MSEKQKKVEKDEGMMGNHLPRFNVTFYPQFCGTCAAQVDAAAGNSWSLVWRALRAAVSLHWHVLCLDRRHSSYTDLKQDKWHFVVF